MFEWKVEDCKLMNDPGATVNDDGEKIFSAETMLSREEKLETESGDIILSQEGRGIEAVMDTGNLERYFSEWFEIIPKEEAERKWYLRELDFCVLRRDGSDCYADCYDTFGEIPEDALFGIEKDKTGGTR